MNNLLTSLLLLLAACASAFPLYLRLRGRGVLDPLLSWWRMVPRHTKAAAAVLLAVCVAVGGSKDAGNGMTNLLGGVRGALLPAAEGAAPLAAKENPRMVQALRGAPLSVTANGNGTFTSDELATGYALASVGTNEGHDFTMPTNAVVAERIVLRGAHRDWFRAQEGSFWIQTDGTAAVAGRPPYQFDLNGAGTGATSNLVVFAVAKGSYGFLPEPLWETYGTSRLWTAEAPSGTRLVTWEGARENRAADAPVTFQAAIRPNGNVTYRYSHFPTNAVAGVSRNGASLPVDLPTNATSALLAFIGDLADGTGDFDADGLTDWEELRVYGTDPRNADSDCDGLGDGAEVADGLDPRNADTDGDGVPDGVTTPEWLSNPLFATPGEANFSVRLRTALPPGASAALRTGGLTLLLNDTATVYYLRLPTNALNTVAFASAGCDGIGLDAQVLCPRPSTPVFSNGTAAGRGCPPYQSDLNGAGTGITSTPNPQPSTLFSPFGLPSGPPYHIDDPTGVLTPGGLVPSGTFSLCWPHLALVPRDGQDVLVHGNDICLHGDATSCLFDLLADPLPPGGVPQDSLVPTNLTREDGGYRLNLDGSDSAAGVVAVTAPWLVGGPDFAIATIHRCAADGLDYCAICDTCHYSGLCDHDPDCAAVADEDAPCTCPPHLVRVNLDDDNRNDVTDKNDAFFVRDDEIWHFMPLADGAECCCSSRISRDLFADDLALPPSLRIKDEDAASLFGVMFPGESLALEATCASTSTNETVSYTVRDTGYFGFSRRIEQRVIAANAVMRRDYNHSGFVTASDAAFAEAHGLHGGNWPMPPSTEPYRIWVRYEIPPDCTFRAVVTGAADLVTISNVVAQTDGDEAFFALPSGSGTLEIEITSSGTDTNGYIQLVMTTPSGDTYGFDGQAFETISSIFEKKTQLALADQGERTPFRLHPALSGFTAVWTLNSTIERGPKIFPAETGGTSLAAITNAFEVWASPGTYSGDNYKISATLEGYGIAEEARYRVFIMIFEPITSATNTLGKTVNPSCVVVRRSGYFKATVSSNIADDEIVWSASSEEAGLVMSTGRMAEVIPTACGAYSLTLRIGDYECARGYIQFLAVEETTTEIRAYILGTNGVFHITAADVTNHVETVNRIYGQIGMKFTLHSVTNIVVTPQQLKIDNPDGGLTKKEVCDIVTGTGGVEIYYVPEVKTNGIVGVNVSHDGRMLGIIVGKKATGITVAHEIGHACGLQDIYVSYPGIWKSVDSTFEEARLPGDWGSTSSDISFYSHKNHNFLIDSLLMMGHESRAGTDIAFGPVFGLWYLYDNDWRRNFRKSLAPVGVTPEFNRHPCHE